MEHLVYDRGKAFSPPLLLFNVAVVLLKTLRYLLTYNTDRGGGGGEGGGEIKWPYRTYKVLQLNF